MEKPVITAWSYSRYGVYDQCPFKAKLLYIDRFKEPGSPAMDKGIAVHSEIEAYLKSNNPVPQCAIKLHADLEALKAQKPYAELEVCFNKDWLPVDWFAKDAWVRIKIDGAKGKEATAALIYETQPVPESWDDIYDYIETNDAFDLLQRRLSVTAVKERWDAGVTIPGIGKFDSVDLSLTKRSSK